MKKNLRYLSFLLTLLLLLSSLPMSLFASNEVTLSYSYANEICGDGEGTITATGLTAGKYALYFVNENGLLPGYEAIEEKTVSSSTATFTLPRAFLLPPEADGIALFSGSTEVAVYDIPAAKKITSDVDFTFASVSDVHMNLDDASTYYGATNKWVAALDFFDKMGMEAVVVSGDLTGSGTSTEYERYKAALEASTYDASNIYEGLGNHDATQIARFLTYTKGEDDVHPSEGTAWFYVMKEGKNGARDNLFIFMAQELTNTSGTHTGDNFSDEQMDWVEGLLETYAGTETNIFLVVHPMIKNFGPGDRVNGAYSQPLYFNDNYPGNMRLKELLTTYKEVIRMSGHTHLSLREGLNFSDENGSAARMIHNPSISQPRGYTSSGSISYNNGGTTTGTTGSEGYLVYVYDECVTYVGYDLTAKKAIPTASYLIPLYSEDRDAAVSIEITKQPTKTEYEDGEWFNGAGMVVTATYANGTTAEVKGWGCSNVGSLSAKDTEVLITYGNCTPVSVSIAVGAAPSKNGEGIFEGSGTADDPYLISSAKDFAALTDLFNDSINASDPCGTGIFYKQTANIDMTGYAGYDGTHILNGSTRKCYFGGIYDGNGYTITVDITYNGEDGQASVFPYITGAILNLKIKGSITSTYSAQPIRTIQAGAVVANCLFDMTLSAPYANALVYSMYGTAYNCYISGTANKIHQTLTTGKYYNCYTSVQNASGSAVSIAEATASDDCAAIAKSFNNHESSDALSGIAAMSAVNAALSEKSLGEVSVKNGELMIGAGEIAEPVIPGSGTKDDPYIIATPAAFKLLTDSFNASTSSSSPYGAGKFYLQTADIDMTDCAGYNGSYFLNSNIVKSYFGGIYDGNGHTITVNIVNTDSGAQTSVFPYITGAILNLKIAGSITSSYSAQPIRTIQAGAVVANCIFDMALSAELGHACAYSMYGTAYNVYMCGTATYGIHSTRSGNYYNCFTYVKKPSGSDITTSQATKSKDYELIAESFNEPASDVAALGLAALSAVNSALDEDVLCSFGVVDGKLVINEKKVPEPVIPGSGTESDPYIIATPEAFKLLTDLFNAATSSSAPYGAGLYFKQTADIDMRDVEGYDGTHLVNKCYFGGIYDGNGHTITVDITYSGSDGQTSVFPYITGAIINLKITGTIDSPESAQPIRTIQEGAVVANCIFDMELKSAARGHACAYSMYGTVYNTYLCGITTTGIHYTRTGNYYNCYTNVKKTSGSAVTTSQATATDDLTVVANGLADRTSTNAVKGLNALSAVSSSLTAEDLITISLYEGALIFGEIPVVKGDLNGDKTISIADVTLLLDVLAGIGTLDDGIDSDFNKDSQLSISDVTMLLDVLAGKMTF